MSKELCVIEDSFNAATLSLDVSKHNVLRIETTWKRGDESDSGYIRIKSDAGGLSNAQMLVFALQKWISDVEAGDKRDE